VCVEATGATSETAASSDQQPQDAVDDFEAVNTSVLSQAADNDNASSSSASTKEIEELKQAAEMYRQQLLDASRAFEEQKATDAALFKVCGLSHWKRCLPRVDPPRGARVVPPRGQGPDCCASCGRGARCQDRKERPRRKGSSGQAQ